MMMQEERKRETIDYKFETPWGPIDSDKYTT